MHVPSHAALTSSSHVPMQFPLHAQPSEQSMGPPLELLLVSAAADDDESELELDDEGSTPVPLGESVAPPPLPLVVALADAPLVIVVSPGSSESSEQPTAQTRTRPRQEVAIRITARPYSRNEPGAIPSRQRPRQPRFPAPRIRFATFAPWARSAATSRAPAARARSSSAAATPSTAEELRVHRSSCAPGSAPSPSATSSS